MSSNDEMVSPITGRTAQMLVVPQDADLLAALVEEARHAAGCSNGDRMIPAQRERQTAAREGLADGRG